MQEKSIPPETRHSWGVEKVLFTSQQCTVKELTFMKGFKTSLHYHLQRVETLYCQSGRFVVRMFDAESPRMAECMLVPGLAIQIPRNTPHQLVCEEGGVLIETTQNYNEEDVLRIFDEALLVRGPSMR